MTDLEGWWQNLYILGTEGGCLTEYFYGLLCEFFWKRDTSIPTGDGQFITSQQPSRGRDNGHAQVLSVCTATKWRRCLSLKLGRQECWSTADSKFAWWIVMVVWHPRLWHMRGSSWSKCIEMLCWSVAWSHGLIHSSDVQSSRLFHTSYESPDWFGLSFESLGRIKSSQILFI